MWEGAGQWWEVTRQGKAAARTGRVSRATVDAGLRVVGHHGSLSAEHVTWDMVRSAF